MAAPAVGSGDDPKANRAGSGNPLTFARRGATDDGGAWTLASRRDRTGFDPDGERTCRRGDPLTRHLPLALFLMPIAGMAIAGR